MIIVCFRNRLGLSDLSFEADQYQTLGEYNALLSLFNITTEKVQGELHGKMQTGLLYIPLNKKGERAGHPFKASLFGKSAGFLSLELHFAKCKTALKISTLTQGMFVGSVSDNFDERIDQNIFRTENCSG